MATEAQSPANPAARFADSTQDDRETLTTSATYMSNRAFHSIMPKIKGLSR